MSMDAPEFYIIHLQAILQDDWADWFEGMSVSNPADLPGQTVLSGYLPDQAALHGLLNKIRDLNLRLIGVERGQHGADSNPNADG
jgi:hypothetical protein